MSRRTLTIIGSLVVASVLLCVVVAACAGGSAPASGQADAPTTRPAQPTKTPNANVTTKPTRTPSAAAKPTRTPSAAAKPTRTPSASGAPQPAAGKAAWTVLVYLDGDNNLESSAIDDFGEMASVGSTDQMNVVVELDRIKSDEDWDDSSNGNWTTAKRFRVTKQMKPTKANQIADLGEVNMGDPQTLADFITWGVQSYPAQHYALIFWDHGASWPGIAFDSSSNDDLLTLPKLAQALDMSRTNTGVDRFDLLGFDACLMSQIDVLQAVAPYGEIAVGSADVEPGEGWAWNSWLADLAKNPNQSASDIAPRIVKSFISFYKKEDQSDVTLSAFDLRKIDALTQRFDTLAAAMIDDMRASYKTIGKARSYAVEYAAGDKDTSAIDMGYFAQSLLDNGAQGAVADAAGQVLAALKGARVALDNGGDYPDGTGISIYFPWKKRNYDTGYADGSPFTRQTRWNDFLTSFYSGGKSKATKSKVSKPVVNTSTPSANKPVTVAAQVSGEHTAYVSYVIGVLDEHNPKTVQILYQDYVYPPGATLGKPIPNWPSEKTEARLTWKTSGWYLSNGANVIPVPFNANEYGTNRYVVDGTYTAKKTGSQKQVRIEFEVAQGRGTLLRALAFDTITGKPQSREFTPTAGDTFTPDITTYTDTGKDELEQGTTPGKAIIFGSDALVAFEGPARNGSYLIGLLVENVAGDVTSQYADITVQNAPQSLPRPPITAPAAPAAPAQPVAADYANADLGFTMRLPAGWEATETGSDKVTFEDKTEKSLAVLAVDVYKLDGVNATQMMGEVLAEMAKEKGYTLGKKPANVTVAGRNGQRATYSFKEHDGTTLAFTTVTLNGADGKVYVLTFVTAAASAAQDQALFEAALASLAFQK